MHPNWKDEEDDVNMSKGEQLEQLAPQLYTTTGIKTKVYFAKEPLFQKRHYEAIIAVLRSSPSDEGIDGIIENFVRILSADNPKFDSIRFLEAAHGI
jgi:hypothetical protein